jgi:hypothetical protein
LYEIFSFLENQKPPSCVIPAEAGIQSFHGALDSRFRGSDYLEGFFQSRQVSYSIKRAALSASD